MAAETVIVRYGLFRAPLAVAELAAWADRGEISPTIQGYLDLAGRSPESVRSQLNRRIPLPHRLLTVILNSGTGDRLLGRLTEAISPPAPAELDRANRQIPDPPTDTPENREALKTALLAASENDDRLTAVELLQAYPADTVAIRLDRLETWLNGLRLPRS